MVEVGRYAYRRGGSPPLEITRFDPVAVDDAESAGYHAVIAASHQVDQPDEPLLPAQELAARLR